MKDWLKAGPESDASYASKTSADFLCSSCRVPAYKLMSFGELEGEVEMVEGLTVSFTCTAVSSRTRFESAFADPL